MSTAAHTDADSRPAPEQPIRQTGLAGFAQKLAGWTERWFPDAFIFALFGVLLITLATFINGSKPKDVFAAVGAGFWDLLAFSLQMAMVVLTGYVVATSKPVRRIIEALARVPKGPRTAVAYVALVSMLVSWVSWGLSIVFGGLLARAVARRRDIRVDYRALGAAAFMGLGSVWALGLSSSSAQLQATAASIPPDLLKITGVLDFGKTIFTWQAFVLLATLWVLVTAVAFFSAPKADGAMTAEMMGVDLDDSVPVAGKPERPGEFWEFNPVLPIFMGLLILGWIVTDFMAKWGTTHHSLGNTLVLMLSSLPAYLMVFLILGLVLHGTPRAFMNAVSKAIPTTAAILVQFPLYAIMAKLLTSPKGWGGHTLAHLLSNIFTGVGHDVFPLVLGLYTMVLGILVPSGGGKWIVEAPYVMDAANRLHYNLGWTVEIYNVCEALPNLINPFFMLPLLSILRVKAKDLVGYTFVQFLFGLPVVLFLIWMLGTTFHYIPPIIPGK